MHQGWPQHLCGLQVSLRVKWGLEVPFPSNTQCPVRPWAQAPRLTTAQVLNHIIVTLAFRDATTGWITELHQPNFIPRPHSRGAFTVLHPRSSKNFHPCAEPGCGTLRKDHCEKLVSWLLGSRASHWSRVHWFQALLMGWKPLPVVLWFFMLVLSSNSIQ